MRSRIRYDLRLQLERLFLAVMTAGVLMLMQPLWLWAFSWSLAVILIGTVGFAVASHLRTGPVQRSVDDRQG